MIVQEALPRPPRTIVEVFKMLPQGTLAELINGIIYMSPSPVSNHQRILGKLFYSLSSIVEKKGLGELFIAPFDVYLDNHSNAVQPDIIFVARENSTIVQDHIYGIPDLLVEILSPGNREYDLKMKKDLYEQFGVKEYWIVDPATKEAIGYQLREGQYNVLPGSTGRIKSVLLDCVITF